MYGSVGADLTQTQPFYSFAHFHDYRRAPGYLTTGYFTAQASQAYSSGRQASAALNPAYYYSSGGRAYFGPWYKPAPLATAPAYAAAPAAHSAHSSSRSSYARRSGDLATSASSFVPSFSMAPVAG